MRSVVSPSISALGDMVRRWRNTGRASALTSSGITKSRPCSTAKARTAAASMFAARVEAPTSSAECARVPRGQVLERGMLWRPAGHVDDVVDERVRQADMGHGLADRCEQRGIRHRLQAEIRDPGHCRAMAVPPHDLPLLVAARMIDDDLEQEAIELRL